MRVLSRHIAAALVVAGFGIVTASSVSYAAPETTVMASDGMGSGTTRFQGISLALSPADEAEAKRLFHALADGGQVQMPLATTFFSKAFGMVADRFGVPWMVVAPA